MFNLFKKKSPLEKLEEAYKKTLKEAHELSKWNRKASDTKTAEADAIMSRMETLTKK